MASAPATAYPLVTRALTAWYGALLYLYPASFRREYGEEMRAVFRAGLSEERGLFSKLTPALGALVEVARNAPSVHYDLARQDLRQACRGFVRSPGFALTAVAVVALGIGANTAVFTVTDYALLRPLPYPHPERLLKLWEARLGYNQMELSPANYRDWKEQETETLESMAAFTRTAANLVDAADPVRLDGALTEASLFQVLGVGPLLGRALTADDELLNAPPTIVLGYRLWQTRFGADPQIVGRAIELDGVQHTIVGVMPRGFLFPTRDVTYWVPLRLDESVYQDRNNNFLEVVARMRSGLTVPTGIAQVRTELRRITALLEQRYPVANRNAGATVYPLRRDYTQDARGLLLAVAGAALCVLLITCVNLANLMLARALTRRRELLVRAAMGAGQERLARQLLTESLLLALIGGSLGVALAWVSLPRLSRLVPPALPIAAAPRLDLGVLAFAAAATVLTGIVVGVAPVLRVTRGGFAALREGQRGGGGRNEPLRTVLVVCGIVCSVVLLVCAGLLLRALWRVAATEPGFRTQGVLTLRVTLPQPQTEQDPYANTAERVRWYQQVQARVAALPGAESAAFVSFLPMTMTGGIWPVGFGEENERREAGNVASLRYVTPGYFETLDIPRLQGRDVRWSDDGEQPFVAVVSQSFAQRYFPGRSPLGERFQFAFFEREIVGVVSDVRVRGLERQSEPQVYLPAGQVPDGWMTFYMPQDLAIRTSVPPRSQLSAVQEIVHRLDPALPITNVRTTTEILAAQTASRSTQLRVVAAFAAIALLLATVGLHGLLSYLVSQRRREIGVRMALGAARQQIVWLVLRRATLLASLGVALGGLLAYVAARSLETLLAGIAATDAVTYASVGGLCAAMTLLGSLVPALRALRVDPATAMRIE